MTTAAWVLLATAAVMAVGNWMAVAARSKPAEYVFKPATLLALIGVALTLNPADPAQRWWFLAALVLSLAGDVFLMLPRDAFIAGLSSFLLAHVAYIGGLALHLDSATAVTVAIAFVFLATVPIAYVIVRGARRKRRALAVPVGAYVAVIAIMVAFALATRNPLAAVGAVLFFASDGLIGWNRFVRPLGWAPVTIMVTYHLGQAGLVLSLT